MATINPGYMGWAKFGDTQFRFESSSVAAKQEINAPDLVTGYWRRMAYNYGKIDISGTISGPVTESFSAAGTGMWDKATTRGSCGELDEESLEIHYFCSTDSNSTWSWPAAKVNSLTFSCSAGDVANFSMDIIAAQAGTVAPEAGTFEDIEKLVTWDKVTLEVAPGGDAGQTFDQTNFSNFEVTFANNVEAHYAMKNTESDLYPFALVDGITTITGSLSVYNIPGMYGADNWDAYATGNIGTLSFNVGSGIQTLNVRWHRVEPAASVGPIISTVAFTGVGKQLSDLNI